METQLLRDPEIFPSREVLKNTLGEVYDVLEALETKLMQKEITSSFDWTYYKDGKSWLCKVAHRKKTIFWLSIWEGFFQTSFFFLERHLEGIAALQIKENSFTMAKEFGKMLPLIFKINKHEQIEDLLKMVEFKMKSK
jgi:hypothetical protein